MNILNNCIKCNFYYHGECRRYPPETIVKPPVYQSTTTIEVENVFPKINDKDFCGEFKNE
jgi:hypothetical protein